MEDKKGISRTRNEFLSFLLGVPSLFPPLPLPLVNLDIFFRE
jgi:hypothetical protein